MASALYKYTAGDLAQRKERNYLCEQKGEKNKSLRTLLSWLIPPLFRANSLQNNIRIANPLFYRAIASSRICNSISRLRIICKSHFVDLRWTRRILFKRKGGGGEEKEEHFAS